MKRTEIDKALIFLNELKQKKTEKNLSYRKQNIREKENHNKYCREYMKRNKNKYTYDKDKQAKSSRKASLKRLYGITPQQYLTLYEKQNGCCAICGIHKDGLKTNLHIDHDHETKEVRGLLCVKCNFALGYVNENPEIIAKMLIYLTKYKK